ncbi:MAG TPA: radical SAM protein [Steroidobacteraceae bacterium]|nr:radical SAM protein [Steroidobacteraceae bacterium]
MTRKVRPYLFYDTTSSLCTRCLRVVEAKIVLKDQNVYMDKWCPAHGTERVLMADDADYYRSCREVWIKPPEMPERFNTHMKYGCPYDCGLCPDHMQHSCLTLVEITDNCNLRCPVCFAGSGPEHLTHKPLPQVLAMLDAIVANEGTPDVVQISGGEPTMHPDFFAIVDAARARPIRHLMINTNGIRIARDPEFAARLAEYRTGFEIYLQFDSFEPGVLKELRGADLSRIHQEALDVLNKLDISTTLVVTLKKGLNDDEIGKIIDFGLAQPCVRGVTLQPIQDAGRVEAYDAKRHRLTVSEIRRRIGEQSQAFTLGDIIPVPCNPDTLAMGYALKIGGATLPLTRVITPQILLEGQGNTITFEHDPELKRRIFDLFATNHSAEGQATRLSELLCCLPQVATPPGIGYRNVFRVLIVQFMDAVSMDIRALKKSCIHIAQPDGRLIPFESFNLFYRAGKEQVLAELRAEVEANIARRLA